MAINAKVTLLTAEKKNENSQNLLAVGTFEPGKPNVFFCIRNVYRIFVDQLSKYGISTWWTLLNQLLL